MVKSVWKNGLLFICLIALIAGFHFFAVNTLDAYISSLCQQGEEVIAMVQQKAYGQALQKVQTMEEKWEEHGRKLCFFIDHEDIEEIGHMIAKVQSNFREETYALAVTEMEEIMAKAKDIYKRETLTLENIF